MLFAREKGNLILISACRHVVVRINSDLRRIASEQVFSFNCVVVECFSSLIVVFDVGDESWVWRKNLTGVEVGDGVIRRLQ
jgi:hypothetical protein